jgi:hypothetical protein
MTVAASSPVRGIALVLGTALALSGCAGIGAKKTPAPCPPIYILSDAAKLTKYKEGPGRDLTDVEMEAEIVSFKGDCSYDDKGAIVTIQVGFDVKRGPAAKTRKNELTYFVAIPKYYPAPEAKAEFSVPVEFPPNLDYARTTDDYVVMRIPVKNKDVVDNYEIYLGFQTTQEQLDANRRNRR